MTAESTARLGHNQNQSNRGWTQMVNKKKEHRQGAKDAKATTGSEFLAALAVQKSSQEHKISGVS